MSATADYLAVDLGADSGRALLAGFDGERMSLEEIHRFPNVPVRAGTLHWDALRLFHEVKRSLAKAARESEHLESVGLDTGREDRRRAGRVGMRKLGASSNTPPERGACMETGLVPGTENLWSEEKVKGCPLWRRSPIAPTCSGATAPSPTLEAETPRRNPKRETTPAGRLTCYGSKAPAATSSRSPRRSSRASSSKRYSPSWSAASSDEHHLWGSL